MFERLKIEWTKFKWWFMCIISPKWRRKNYCIELYHNLSGDIYKNICYFRKIKMSHPMNLTDKEWDEILEKIAGGFYLIHNRDEIIDAITNELERDGKKNISAEEIFEKRHIKEINEAFDLLKKWFFDLWS